MKQIILGIAASLIIGLAMAQYPSLILPSEMPREQVIHHKAFSMSYNSSYVMPSWITYLISSNQPDKSKEENGKYKEDPAVTSRAANKKDYKDAGYLMAQFVNYFDVQNIKGAVAETFYMTNITPMKQAFYLHVWLKTEDLIRLWAANSLGFQVISGPILTDAPFPTIGESKVSVPTRFYKIVYDAGNQKAVAFVFKNGSTSGTLKSHSVSVDEIEKFTGIDFFPQLDDDIENLMEASVDFIFWNFKMEEELK